MKISLAVLVLCIAAGVSAQLDCPLAPSSEFGYSIRAEGSIIVGFHSCIRDAVAGGQIIFNDRSSATGVVWSGTGIQIDSKVDLGNKESDEYQDFAFVWATDRDSVVFVDDEAPQAIVCTTSGPSGCDIPTSLSCAARAGLNEEVGSTLEEDDAFIKERWTTQRVKQGHQYSTVQVPVPTRITTKHVFRDLTIGRRAHVIFDDYATIYARNIHIEEDAVIYLQTADKDYSFYVQNSFDMDERVEIRTHNNRLVVYQHGDRGYVFISSAPANRSHVLNLDIIARASYASGGYVSIGYRQYLNGFIVARSDVIIQNAASVGRKCFNNDDDDDDKKKHHGPYSHKKKRSLRN